MVASFRCSLSNPMIEPACFSAVSTAQQAVSVPAWQMEFRIWDRSRCRAQAARSLSAGPSRAPRAVNASQPCGGATRERAARRTQIRPVRGRSARRREGFDRSGRDVVDDHEMRSDPFSGGVRQDVCLSEHLDLAVEDIRVRPVADEPVGLVVIVRASWATMRPLWS
jgi:hypothetical protein